MHWLLTEGGSSLTEQSARFGQLMWGGIYKQFDNSIEVSSLLILKVMVMLESARILPTNLYPFTRQSLGTANGDLHAGPPAPSTAAILQYLEQ
jgi:hypothetical protein